MLPRVPGYSHCPAAGRWLFAADRAAALRSSSEFLVYLPYATQVSGIQLSAGSWQHRPSQAHTYNKACEVGKAGDGVSGSSGRTYCGQPVPLACSPAGKEGAGSLLPIAPRYLAARCPTSCLCVGSQSHRTPVSTASCYQSLKSHLFSLPFVVVALSILTPDPTELLLSSFNNCIYRVLGGWLFSPCQSSAILSPAQDASWPFPAWRVHDGCSPVPGCRSCQASQ